MTTQPQFQGVIGDTASVLLVMFGPRQLDHHVMLWRWMIQSPRPITRWLPKPMIPPRCMTQALTSGTRYTSAGIS